MVDLQHLRVFVRISELKSFTKAAVSLGITQPSVSYTIKELEKAWGGELFYRTGRGVMLSEFGEHAVLRAKSLMDAADKVFEEVRAYSGLPSGSVALGLPHSLIPTLLPELLNQLRHESPGIHLKVREAFSDHISRWLSEGEIDLGICNQYAEGSIEENGALYGSPLVLASPSPLLPLPAQIAFAELADYPLVLPAAPNGLRLFIDGIARRLRVTLNVKVDADTIYAQKQMCEACGYFMISAPRSLIGESAELAASSLIVEPFVHRSVAIHTTQHRPLSRAAREVAKRVATILKTLPRS